MSSWTNIESDPGVFTELVEKFGASGAEFAELYALDDAEFARLGHVFGLIFLFKWTGEKDDRVTLNEDAIPPGLFYAKQMVSNACASQAILGVLLNVEGALDDDDKDHDKEEEEEDKESQRKQQQKQSGLKLGETLRELRAFARDLPADMRGLAIENSEAIKVAHNSFARPEPFLASEERAKKDDDVFHFVAYVPFKGHVYELDGLKTGPIDLGEVNKESNDWLAVARAAVSERVQKYAASEIKFNLMAIVRDARQVLQEHRDELEAAMLKAPDDASLVADLADLDAKRDQELAKRDAWKLENERRRHNYVPLAVDLFKVLAEKGHLQALVDAARDKSSSASSDSSQKKKKNGGDITNTSASKATSTTADG